AARNGDVFSNPLEGKPHPGDGGCEACVDVVYLAKNQAQRYGADLSNTSRFDTALGPVQLNYGFSLQKEDVAPSDSVKKTQEDFDNNNTLRSGIRNEQSAFLNMQWQANDRLLLEAGGRYIHYNSKDRNVTSTAVREKQGWQFIKMWDKDGNDIGYTVWRQNENGEFTDATNPIKNGKGTLVPDHEGEESKPIDLSKVESWDTTGSVNYDKIPGAFTRTAPVERSGGGFAPAFSATYRLTDTTSTYLRYTEGLRMPSMFESTVGFSARYSSPLEPEHSKNWEAGISYVKDGAFKAEDKLRLKVAYFNNNTENYITRRSFDGVPGMQNFTMHNLDNYSISGFEFQSSYDGGDFFGELAATLNQASTVCDSKMAAYFRAKGENWPEARETPDCSSVGFNTSYVSNMIPPRIMANGTFGTRQLDQKLTLGLRASYVSGPLNVTENKIWTNYTGTSVQIKTLPYTLVDLFASYKINADTRVDMTMDNATDRYYLDPLTLSLMPGPGRTVRMSLGMKF
ncbi:MAG: TonB-dependent receptor domain-containing protein, partial [Iodobacter sp.]